MCLAARRTRDSPAPLYRKSRRHAHKQEAREIAWCVSAQGGAGTGAVAAVLDAWNICPLPSSCETFLPRMEQQQQLNSTWAVVPPQQRSLSPTPDSRKDLRAFFLVTSLRRPSLDAARKKTQGGKAPRAVVGVGVLFGPMFRSTHQTTT